TTITSGDANFYLVQSDAVITTSTSNIPNHRVNGGNTAAVCISFSDSFSAAAINANKWVMTSLGTASAAGDFSIVNGQAQISVSGVQGLAKSNHLFTKDTYSGDFSAEVILRSLTATGGASSGASLTFSMSPTDSNEANHHIAVVRRLGNSTLLATKSTGSGSPVDQATANIGLTASSPVKVKLQRAGTNVKVFYDINDGQGYKQLKDFGSVANVPVKLSIVLGSFETVYPTVTAKIDDFNLICVAGTSTPTPTPTGTTGAGTPTPTPSDIPVTGNTVLDLKLKFQGIGSKPDDSRNFMNVKFTLSGADLSTPLVKSGTFRSDANGVWTGKVGFDLTSPANKKYILYIKGPKHVQKKICDNAPSESSGGTYRCGTANMTLALGDNNKFDLSKVLLLSGDIYGPDKVQDGIVNSVDISYVKNNLRKTDASVLAVCDINLDGKCDTQDYSLIISALSIKNDEL
ncbi:MAG: dockerin type I domain-containing protein, partial [Methylococcales bacterium]|nr:dockerin type I domain-containing protein [Methylococcales bacterium]